MTKTAKPHPADGAARAQVEAAKSFSVHLRRGPHFKINEPAATLEAAIEIADRIALEHKSKTPLIYAITKEDFTVLVPKDLIAGARAVRNSARKRQVARSKKPTAIDPGIAAPLPVGQRAALLADAEKGILPPAPGARFQRANARPISQKTRGGGGHGGGRRY